MYLWIHFCKQLQGTWTMGIQFKTLSTKETFWGKKNLPGRKKVSENTILYTEKMGNSCLGSSYALFCLGEPQLEASVLFWAWQHLKSMWTNERKSRRRQQEWVSISGNKTKAERCRGMVFSLQIEKRRGGMVTVKYRKRSWKTRGRFVDRIREKLET